MLRFVRVKRSLKKPGTTFKLYMESAVRAYRIHDDMDFPVGMMFIQKGEGKHGDRYRAKVVHHDEKGENKTDWNDSGKVALNEGRELARQVFN